MKFTYIWHGLLAIIISILAGCGGNDGAVGPAGPAGSNVGSYLVTVGSNSASPSAEAIAAWKALSPQVTVTSVSTAGPTVVSFTVKDAAGNAVVGLGNRFQSASSVVSGLTNFISRWQSWCLSPAAQ